MRIEGADKCRVSSETDVVGPDRRRLVAAELDDGSLVGFDRSREMGWPVDLERETARIEACERGTVLLWTGEKFTPVPMFCGARLCPRCVRARTGRLIHRLLPPLLAAANDGAGVYLLTLTQPTDSDDGALVLPEESRRWIGSTWPGEVFPSVGGESMLASYERLRGHFTAVREARGTRKLWKHALGGYVYGIEWTLRAKGARGPVIPRWHCHLHVLAVVPGGWPDFKGTWDALRRSWVAEVPGASHRAQDCARVQAREGQELSSAILEVLKYPLKLGDLTTAGTIEAYGSLRGSRPHHVGGAMHATSKASQEAPWKGWLATRTQPPSWPRVMVRPTPGHEWALYTGQFREGMMEFTAGTLPAWPGDAAAYYKLLRSRSVPESELGDAALDDD